MTTEERVLAVAREYGERHFYPNPLSSAEIAGESISVGGGCENWLVRVESQYHALMVAVLVGPDGTAEAIHHTRLAAA